MRSFGSEKDNFMIKPLLKLTYLDTPLFGWGIKCTQCTLK